MAANLKFFWISISLKNEVSQVNFNTYKIISNWQPFMDRVYICSRSCCYFTGVWYLFRQLLCSRTFLGCKSSPRTFNIHLSYDACLKFVTSASYSMMHSWKINYNNYYNWFIPWSEVNVTHLYTFHLAWLFFGSSGPEYEKYTLDCLSWLHVCTCNWTWLTVKIW